MIVNALALVMSNKFTMQNKVVIKTAPLIYRKRPNKRPGRLLRCPVGEEGEGAFIKAIYELG